MLRSASRNDIACIYWMFLLLHSLGTTQCCTANAAEMKKQSEQDPTSVNEQTENGL